MTPVLKVGDTYVSKLSALKRKPTATIQEIVKVAGKDAVLLSYDGALPIPVESFHEHWERKP